MKKIAVVMAGGMGTRFWPRTTERLPKQFAYLIGDGTMIQNTVGRLRSIFDTDDIYIVTSENYSSVVSEQLPEIVKDNIILEPFPRNTAPCLGLTATVLSEKYPADTIMAVFPSDHVIFNMGEFYNSLETAYIAAYELSGIVTIGINPTRPETQFGYVQIKEQRGKLGSLYDSGVRYTTTFAEKPDLATARRFIDSGDFVWNSGIFFWRFDTFLESFTKYLPEDAANFKSLRKHIGKDSFRYNLEYIYRQQNSISVDYAILEKADNVLVVQSSFSWSDLGTWDELYRLSMKDASNNVIEGDVVYHNISNCLISSKGKLISAIGIEDLIVIENDDALLICKRGKSESVKDLIDIMKKNNNLRAL